MAFDKLRLEYTPRAQFIEKYRRTTIMTEMSRDILKISEII
jgi:hypothetical protein